MAQRQHGLHGTQKSLCPRLTALRELFVTNTGGVREQFFEVVDTLVAQETISASELPGFFQKQVPAVHAMISDAQADFRKTATANSPAVQLADTERVEMAQNIWLQQVELDINSFLTAQADADTASSLFHLISILQVGNLEGCRVHAWRVA